MGSYSLSSCENGLNNLHRAEWSQEPPHLGNLLRKAGRVFARTRDASAADRLCFPHLPSWPFHLLCSDLPLPGDPTPARTYLESAVAELPKSCPGRPPAPDNPCLGGALTGVCSFQICREKPSVTQARLCPLLFLPVAHGPQSSSQNTSCCEAAF